MMTGDIKMTEQAVFWDFSFEDFEIHRHGKSLSLHLMKFRLKNLYKICIR